MLNKIVIKALFILLIIILSLMGCTPPLSEKTATPTPTISTPQPTASPSPTLAATLTPTQSIMPINKNATKADMERYFSMKKSEIIKELGNDYELVGAGAEASEEGYSYEKTGLVFVFGYEDVVDLIECEEIEGAKAGMNFTQIQEKLGTAKIEDTFVELPEYKAYELNYKLSNCTISCISNEKDGSQSWIWVH